MEISHNEIHDLYIYIELTLIKKNKIKSTIENKKFKVINQACCYENFK